jgi:transcriptional regulator with XRE-family HTH domain
VKHDRINPDEIALLAETRARLLDGRTAYRLRTEAHLTLRDVARHLGVGPATIFRIENGQVKRPGRELTLKYSMLLAQLEKLVDAEQERAA